MNYLSGFFIGVLTMDSELPRAILEARNISEDGLTRWSQYECEQWMYAHGIQMVDIPEQWRNWELEWEQRMASPTLSTFALMGHMLDFYISYRTRAAGRRPKLFSTKRLLGDRDIPSYYI